MVGLPYRFAVAWAPAVLLLGALIGGQPQAVFGAPRHGASMDGFLRYPAGFSHYGYAEPTAQQGGSLTLASVGSFDTLNPFGLKGRAPLFLGGVVFETLMENSLDEPFSMYGLLAESIDVAADGLSVTFRLHPKARFADGKPVTPQDVVFSFRILRSDAATPLYRFYYRDIASVEAVGARAVRLKFSRRNKELPLIAGQVPVLPRHYYGNGDFGRDFVARAMGSGPYRVEKHDFGKSIAYAR
ncbi:MAG: ABC transporter substrate-binding protein, partial [bacterium]